MTLLCPFATQDYMSAHSGERPRSVVLEPSQGMRAGV
jgi:hypothetical protein